MNTDDMRKMLSDFLESATPEQLRAELEKGHRPFLQTIADPVLAFPAPAVPAESSFLFPASVCFFQGAFTESSSTTSTALADFRLSPYSDASLQGIPAENQELELAA
jgi:hypothetical protein